ncbi:MAG: DUF4442 domain-containing protein [Cyclobacteriaceae bacterium]
MSTTTITLTPAQEAFKKKMLNVWLFRTFAFFKVPMGWLSGMRLTELTTERAVATQPFKWLNMNPFKSTYFAVQSMAAELSTAAIGLLAIEGNNPSIATIIIDMKAEFPKKATGRVTFTCEDGQQIFEAVERAKSTGEAATVTAKTVGTMADGTVVSVFEFTWSFKQRRR